MLLSGRYLFDITIPEIWVPINWLEISLQRLANCPNFQLFFFPKMCWLGAFPAQSHSQEGSLALTTSQQSHICKTHHVKLGSVVFFLTCSWPCKSISRNAQYVTLQKYFHIQALVIYFFPTTPITTKPGIANRWETTNSRPGLIKLSSQSEMGSSQ
jgi:hypothetical protein